MKRFLSIFLICVLLCGSLASCGGEEPAGGEPTAPSDASTAETTDGVTTAPDTGVGTGTETGTGHETKGSQETQAPTPPTTADNFVPILRFAVGSDTHLANTVTAEDERLVKLFTSAYAYSDAHEAYKGLDGVFIVGDCVDKGTQEAMDRFFAIVEDNLREGTVSFNPMGNHEYYTTKYMDGLTEEEIYAETVRMYTEASGYEDVDWHTTIGGYHFIFLSPDKNGWNFSASKQNWLKAELQKAAAEDPTGRKPIFVFQHEPVKGTVLGSEGSSGVDTLDMVLNFYPQVVDFAGHSHYPLNDPRSIHQKKFTSLNTGAMKYLSYDIAGVELDDIANATDYEGGWGFLTDATVIPDGGAYYIVEVSADNALLVHGYDVDGEDFCMEPIFIPSVGDRTEFLYTDARKQDAETPVFGADAAVTVGACGSSTVTVSFPQAACRDLINHYRAELYAGETLVASKYVLSGMAQLPVPETRTVTFGGLTPDRDYTVKILPVSSYAKEGAALTAAVSTEALVYTRTDLPEADVFCLDLYENGTAMDDVSMTNLTPSTAGMPKVEEDETLGRLTASFDGASNYLFDGITSQYEHIRGAVTMEVLVRIDGVSGASDAIFSNCQSGGLGINAKAGSMLEFIIHLGGSDYVSVKGNITEGVYVHGVGVYDGASVKLYLNGVLADEVAATGSMKIPASSAQYLCVGADSQPSRVGDAPFAGAIAVANIYSEALTADQICSLYMDYVG